MTISIRATDTARCGLNTATSRFECDMPPRSCPMCSGPTLVRLVPAAGEAPSRRRHYRMKTGGSKLAEIIARCAKETGVIEAQLTGDRRTNQIIFARHYAFWCCVQETGASLSAIGRAFGDRDHTAILHGCKKHAERMKDPVFMATLLDPK